MTSNSILSKIIINNIINVDISFDLPDYVSKVCKLLSLDIHLLEFTLLPSQDIQKMNNEHFQNNVPTDTISFNLSTNELITGDVYLCTDVIGKNAIEYGESFEKELKIVLIHSILHIIGYEDNNENSRKKMLLKQNQIYQQLSNES